MDGPDFINQVVADDIKRQIEALGFTAYEFKVQVRAEATPELQFVDPKVSVSLSMPQTVLQLRTFARSLHFKYLKEEGGRVVGTTYILARASDEKPIGIVDASIAADIQEKAALLAASIPVLPGNPRVDSPALNDRSYTEVIRDAKLQRWLNATYGDIVIQNRQKPGPNPRDMAEVMEIVELWLKWERNGQSQDDFAAHMGWKSRTILSYCLRRVRAEFGSKSI